jgi:endonuclease YncB( thermonuclease family)
MGCINSIEENRLEPDKLDVDNKNDKNNNILQSLSYNDLEDIPFADYKFNYAKLCKFYDGDTCDIVFIFHGSLLKKRMRLWGIDTPEIRQPKILDEKTRLSNKNRAIKARDRFKELTLDKLCEVEVVGLDKYGRLLCKIFIDFENKRTNVRDVLIKENLGVEYFGGKKI